MPGPADQPVSRPGVLFSLVVTFYNQREFVRAALDSALAQQRDTLEIIAVDDGSTDGTQDVLRPYGDSIRLVLLDENQGVSAARNRGAAEATGKYLLFLDGDDALPPWAIDVYETLATAKRPVVMMGQYLWFEGDLPEPEDFPREVRFVEYGDYFEKDRSVGARAGAMAVKRESFEAVGGWRPGLHPGEDYDLVWRLGTAGTAIYITEPETTLHRAHPRQVTQQHATTLKAVIALAEAERSGAYPGGRERSLQRKACVGGCIAQWAWTLRRNSYRDVLRLVAGNTRYLLAALLVRARARLAGRQPLQVLPIDSSASDRR